MPTRRDIERFIDAHRIGLARGAGAVVGLAIVLVASLWWFEWRTRRPPSIFDSPVDGVASFFASDDFNALSVEERMDLIAQFVTRFRGLSQSDSLVLSSFMAGLTGKSMEQLRQNVRVLARDIMKEGAAGYFQLPPAERAAYMDQWVLKWMKFGERVERGEERAISDEDRLASMRGDAARERERGEERQSEMDRMSERDAVRFVDFWRREVETVASPREQGQIMKFMQDLRSHLGG